MVKEICKLNHCFQQYHGFGFKSNRQQTRAFVDNLVYKEENPSQISSEKICDALTNLQAWNRVESKPRIWEGGAEQDRMDTRVASRTCTACSRSGGGRAASAPPS
jgi:hypothetical protein